MIPRAAAFLGVWLVVAGADPGDLPAGAVAVVAATWVSLRLLPPGAWRPRPVALAGFALRFAWLSVLGGWDVARRALAPQMSLRPGFVAYPVRFPPGVARNVFATLTSLIPGTVPAGNDGGALLYHCQYPAGPVASQLATEEATLSRVLGDPPGDA